MFGGPWFDKSLHLDHLGHGLSPGRGLRYVPSRFEIVQVPDGSQDHKRQQQISLFPIDLLASLLKGRIHAHT